MTTETLRTIGKIVGAHGLRGDVAVHPMDEDAPWADVLKTVLAVGPKGTQVLEIAGSRTQGKHLILRFKSVTDRNGAEALKGFVLKADQAQLPDLHEDEFYTDDLVGMTVKHATSGQTLGTVAEVLSSTAGEFLEVTAPHLKESVLVPFQTVFVPHVDRAQGVITVQGLDGLFEQEP